MTFLRRLAQLERLRLPPPPIDRPSLERQYRILKRWVQLAHAALPLVPEEQLSGMREALGQLGEHLRGPYDTWLQDLRDGWCRLPQLAPAAMKDLLLAWLSPEADGGTVCAACGLEFPRRRPPPLSAWKLLPGRRPFEGTPPWYDLPEFFRFCSHCGVSSFEADWPHLVPQHDYA